jgi:hypothetical protein
LLFCPSQSSGEKAVEEASSLVAAAPDDSSLSDRRESQSEDCTPED